MSRSSFISRFLRAMPGALCATLCCQSGLAQTVEQFPFTDVWSVASAPDGGVWFSYQRPGVGRIDASGTMTHFPLGNSLASGLAFDADGNLWFTGAIGGPPSGAIVEAWIGRRTPSGALTEFPVSDAGNITAGADGNLWFTEISSPRIGRITPSGGVTEFAIPSQSPAAAIASGPDGNLWFTQPTAHKIGRITPSGTVTEFYVPGGQPYGIAAGPDGNVWFTENSAPRIGRISPNGVITEFPISGDAYAIVAGADGNLWAAGSHTLRRIALSGAATDFSVPTVGGGDWYPANPMAMAATPDGSIWIADFETSQIVRFSAQGTACVADATTLCLDNGRFRVTADWKARDGSTGHGHGVNLTASSGYFWFFDSANVEMVVKVLDGCSANQHHWAFAAGLTNVEVATTVTDTYTGNSRAYTNPMGTAFAPVQDTATFATCP